MRSFVVLSLFALVACAGGSEDAGGEEGKGALRQPCYANGSCNLGLSCIGGSCVEVGRGGDLQCCHTSDFSCDLSSLACVGAPGIPLCLQQGVGGPHQKCYDNGTCNAGLVCKGIACVTEAESIPNCASVGVGGSGGAAGSGTGNTGNTGNAAGSGTAGTGTAGTGTAGTGTAGTGTAGTGTAGTGTAGSSSMTCAGCVCDGAPSTAWDNFCVMSCSKMCTMFVGCVAVPAQMGLPTCMCTCGG